MNDQPYQQSPIEEPCKGCIHRMLCCLVICNHDAGCQDFLSKEILNEIDERKLEQFRSHKGQNLSLFGGNEK